MDFNNNDLFKIYEKLPDGAILNNPNTIIENWHLRNISPVTCNIELLKTTVNGYAPHYKLNSISFHLAMLTNNYNLFLYLLDIGNNILLNKYIGSINITLNGYILNAYQDTKINNFIDYTTNGFISINLIDFVFSNTNYQPVFLQLLNYNPVSQTYSILTSSGANDFFEISYNVIHHKKP